MDVVVILDDNNGMCFNGRRLSMDSVLREHMISFFGNRTIYMNSYSASQFDKTPFVVREDFLAAAGANDVCFVENHYLAPLRDKIGALYVYRWNRLYPSDMKIDLPLHIYPRRVLMEFSGSSHNRITLEVYDVKSDW